MVKVNSLLSQRFKRATQKFSSKMTALAELSSSGNLSSFSGVFRVTPLTAVEQEALRNLLDLHTTDRANLKEDLQQLSALTTEVKAINNQAAILHGERIKKAQEILKKYKDGAFTSWLMTTYGNRQTPYNFLQYYELYTALPQMLHSKLEEMPRQAVYTLASRNGSSQEKQLIVQNYKGEPKQELLALIREAFPLAKQDKRAQDFAELALSSFTRLKQLIEHPEFQPKESQRQELREGLTTLLKHL
ncbi:MAG: CT583 family protein [Chlamydiales bacterium]